MLTENTGGEPEEHAWLSISAKKCFLKAAGAIVALVNVLEGDEEPAFNSNGQIERESPLVSLRLGFLILFTSMATLRVICEIVVGPSVDQVQGEARKGRLGVLLEPEVALEFVDDDGGDRTIHRVRVALHSASPPCLTPFPSSQVRSLAFYGAFLYLEAPTGMKFRFALLQDTGSFGSILPRAQAFRPFVVSIRTLFPGCLKLKGSIALSLSSPRFLIPPALDPTPLEAQKKEEEDGRKGLGERGAEKRKMEKKEENALLPLFSRECFPQLADDQVRFSLFPPPPSYPLSLSLPPLLTYHSGVTANR